MSASEQAEREILTTNKLYTDGLINVKEYSERNRLILSKFYKAKTIEFLEILEAQHNVTDLLRYEGTD